MRTHHFSRLALLLMACTAVFQAWADTLEKHIPALRCGWFENPTPGNAWLTDRDGQWIVAAQGGPQAEADWPTFKSGQWVETNIHYGYGCACMRVVTDASARPSQITKIFSASARPLATCRNDPTLKEPKG